MGCSRRTQSPREAVRVFLWGNRLLGRKRSSHYRPEQILNGGHLVHMRYTREGDRCVHCTRPPLFCRSRGSLFIHNDKRTWLTNYYQIYHWILFSMTAELSFRKNSKKIFIEYYLAWQQNFLFVKIRKRYSLNII